MKVDEKVLQRLNKLISESDEVVLTNTKSGAIGGRNFVDLEKSQEWGMLCLNIISRVFGAKSIYFQQFETAFRDIIFTDNVKMARGILKAAKDDYEGGYLFDTRVLIEAEVFDEFLEQAEELFKKGYYQAAAVISGCVLEDGLRKLCDRNSITLPAKATIDPMNVELAKAGIYTKLVQKKITHLADLRNKAAHGEWSEFTKEDVGDMIRDVRRFMEDYFS
jgi:uncharacterized protein (UPF0332 family)